jgi:outer membrane protein assembly factor BamB
MRSALGRLPRKTGLVLTLAAVLAATAGGPALAAPSGDSPSWLVYHGNPAGTGVATSAATVRTASRAWTSPSLDGEIYGEPLVSAGRVYVATENNTVYALSSATGRVAWSKHLASPVPADSLLCGNIRPTVGITGTPVIDQARGEIFVVADEEIHGKPAHMLVGLSTSTGKVEMTQDVDPAGADPAALLQRTGLTLDGGRVVFGFSGNYGDCATYRGRVVAAAETGGKPAFYTVDAAAGQAEGGIWMGGAAPAVDSAGHIWVSVGNGSVRSAGRPYDHSDSVLELSPSLRLLGFFAPSTWAADNASDQDMSSEPVLLAGGQVLIAGKSQIAYLLDGAHLGGVGGQRAMLRVPCGADIDGGSAVVGSTVYLPCLNGTLAVRVAKSPARLRLLWNSGTGGGPPIVVGGRVWTISQDGTLYGLDPGTGKVRQQAAIGPLANHFPTPSVGGGLLLAAITTQVVAFTASAAGPAATGTATAPATAAPSGGPGAAGPAQPSSTGGLPGGAIAGIVAGALVALGGVGWLLRRRLGHSNG